MGGAVAGNRTPVIAAAGRRTSVVLQPHCRCVPRARFERADPVFEAGTSTVGSPRRESRRRESNPLLLFGGQACHRGHPDGASRELGSRTPRFLVPNQARSPSRSFPNATPSTVDLSRYSDAGATGFEPATCGFGDRCATNCATPLWFAIQLFGTSRMCALRVTVGAYDLALGHLCSEFRLRDRPEHHLVDGSVLVVTEMIEVHDVVRILHGTVRARLGLRVLHNPFVSLPVLLPSLRRLRDCARPVALVPTGSVRPHPVGVLFLPGLRCHAGQPTKPVRLVLETRALPLSYAPRNGKRRPTGFPEAAYASRMGALGEPPTGGRLSDAG